MIKRTAFYFLSFIMALWLGFGCVTQPSAKPAPIVIPGGTVAPAIGVGFDVNYDSELDSVVPGYKILTVAYKNNSMNIIQMDPVNDRWIVEDRRGRKMKAIINLRNEDPDTWAALPKRLKMLIEYPLLIPIGTTQTIDLLFKQNVNLSEFRAVTFRAGGSHQEFRILPRAD